MHVHDRADAMAVTLCVLHRRVIPAGASERLITSCRMLLCDDHLQKRFLNVSLGAMSDDKTKSGAGDRERINVSEDYELRDWSKSLGVTPEKLKEAVQKVGPMVDDVKRELGK